MRRRYAVLLVLATTSSVLAQTQQSVGAVKLRGRVLDSATRAPIAGASIELSQTDLHGITDSAGRFALASPPWGKHVLRARHVGYVVGKEELSISSDDTLEHVIILNHLPVQLREVVLSGKQVTFPRFFEDAYKRAASGRGVFFTREDIEGSNANDYKPLLDRIPGVSANDRGVTFRGVSERLIHPCGIPRRCLRRRGHLDEARLTRRLSIATTDPDDPTRNHESRELLELSLRR